MDYFAQQALERQQDRNEIAQVREELKSVKIRTAMLDSPQEIIAQAKRETRVPAEHLRKWGFDPRNPAHREAWRKRNDPL